MIRCRKGSLTSPFLPKSRAYISLEKVPSLYQDEKNILTTANGELTEMSLYKHIY